MVIDSHLHVWSIPAVDYYGDKPLPVYMEENGIDVASLIAVSEAENAQVRAAVRGQPDRYFGIGYVNHLDQARSLDQLRRDVKEGTVRGVKLYPYAEHFMLDSEEINPIYEACLELDIPVLFHVGWQRSSLVHPSQKGAKPCKYATLGYPIQFGTVLERYPSLKMILAHMGADSYFQCLGIAQRFENVWLDTAWLQHYAEEQLPSVTVQEWIEHACKYLGSKKILFGGEGTLPEDIRRCSITAAEREDILGGNAKAIYKL